MELLLPRNESLKPFLVSAQSRLTPIGLLSKGSEADEFDANDWIEQSTKESHLLSTAPIATSLFVASVSCFAPAVFAADALTIRDLAPDNSVLVVGLDDIHGTLNRLGPTAFGKLWNDPAIAEDVKKFKGLLDKSIVDASAEAGIAREDVTWPSSAGFALMTELDEELGIPTLQFVFFCDWSAEAEKAARFCDAVIEKMQKTAKDAGNEMKADEVRGRRVLTSAAKSGDDEKSDADGDDDADDEEGAMGMGMPDIAPKEFCMSSDKGRIFVASSKGSMDMLLGRVDGDHAKSIGDSATFKGAIELSGGTQDMYAVLMTDAAKPLLAMAPQFMLVEPLIKRFFGNIQAWSFGMHANDGVFESCAGIYVPDGKVGLLSLVDTASEPKPAPAIVPSDAMSYGRMNLRFDRIVPMIDEVIAGLPAEQGEMISPQLDMYRPAMNAAFAAIGPEIHLWSNEPNATDPLSGGMVTAIAMKSDKESAAAVSDFMNLLPLGLQSRDFNGMTIMSDEFAPMAIGLGGGYMVLGEVKQVEQALRSVDAKGEAGLASDAQYTASLATMGKDPVIAMAWFNIARQMASAVGSVKDMADRVEGMANIDSDAEVPGLGVGMDDMKPMYDLMKPEVIKRCFADGLLEFKPTSTGFSTRYRMMPAASK